MKCMPFALTALALFSSIAAFQPDGRAQNMNPLNDLEMAHVAITASNVDIAYAHIALAISDTPAIRQFAETMIRDHSAVNGQVVALAEKLKVQAQDNAMSQQLLKDSTSIKDQLMGLRGAAFDAFYAKNELSYHRVVNSLVANQFIPRIVNVEVKRAFEGALTIFRGHERHAEQLASRLTSSMDGK